MIKKLVYIAAPFFNNEQTARVELVERELKILQIPYYSPRKDGVLLKMTPDERRQKANEIFKTNVRNITYADAILAILDVPDTGTHWECGFAYALQNRGKPQLKLMAFVESSKPLNVMLAQSFNAIANGREALEQMLDEYAEGKPFAPAKLSDVY